MADRAWCPNCRSLRHRFDQSKNPDQCRRCDADLEEDWPLHVRAWVKVVGALAVGTGVLVFAGPPLYVIYRVLQGGPLYASETITKTVTKTEHYGILPDIAPVVVTWTFLLLIAFAVLHGPRRI